MTQKTLTPEQLEKKERMRKNLRLLALAAAIYYFISAGFSFYEDHEAQKTRLLPDVSAVFASEESYLEVLKAVVPDANLTLQTAPNDESVILRDGQSTGITASMAPDGSVAICFEAPFPEGGLSSSDMDRLKSYLTACENTTKTETIDEIVRVLHLDRTSFAEVVDGMGAGSKYVRYTLAAQDHKISIKAFANR